MQSLNVHLQARRVLLTALPFPKIEEDIFVLKVVCIVVWAGLMLNGGVDMRIYNNVSVQGCTRGDGSLQNHDFWAAVIFKPKTKDNGWFDLTDRAHIDVHFCINYIAMTSLHIMELPCSSSRRLENTKCNLHSEWNAAMLSFRWNKQRCLITNVF